MRVATIRPARRAAHLAGDLVLIGWAILWLGIALAVRSAINAMAGPVLELERGTTSLAQTVDKAAGSLAEVQFVGEQLAAPFLPIADSLREISGLATEQVGTIQQAAFAVAVVVWLAPTLTLALIYLPRRVRRARESAMARAWINDQADLDLFALRAMANAPVTSIAAISNDPLTAWRNADADVIQQLANLELTRVGIGVAIVEPPATAERPR